MSYGPVPLIIGTTGHRALHLDDIALLETRVHEFFAQLRNEYQQTPLQLLSALAEGADRLVARIALSLGIELIVPLPLPLEDYETDFATAASKAEMRELLSRAKRVLVVPGSGGDRDAAYARLGAWLAHHSQIILALWDESDNQRPGGTADVVRLKREGIGDSASGGQQPLDPADTGPVHVIHARRAGDPDAAGVGVERTLYPRNYGAADAAAETFENICGRTEEFNADAVKLARHLEQKRRTSRDDLVSQLHDDATTQALAPTIDLYTYGDSLAGYFQRWTLRALNWLFILVGLAVLSFAFFAHEVFDGRFELPLLWTYLALFFAAIGLHLRVTAKRFQDRYLDYRALAEGLRVQFYWYVAGVADSAADRYLIHQRYELDWIRNALRACDLATERRPAPDRAGLQHALDAWVAGQQGYFKKTVAQEHVRLVRITRVVRALIVFGVLATVAYGLAVGSGCLSLDDHQRSWFVVTIALPAAAAALLHGWAEKRALESHVKRYGRILVVFDVAKERLEQHLQRGDDAAARRVLHDLGLQALEENGDWVILHRDRPLEVPQPG